MMSYLLNKFFNKLHKILTQAAIHSFNNSAHIILSLFSPRFCWKVEKRWLILKSTTPIACEDMFSVANAHEHASILSNSVPAWKGESELVGKVSLYLPDRKIILVNISNVNADIATLLSKGYLSWPIHHGILLEKRVGLFYQHFMVYRQGQ